jgi:hypothetical protein
MLNNHKRKLVDKTQDNYVRYCIYRDNNLAININVIAANRWKIKLFTI